MPLFIFRGFSMPGYYEILDSPYLHESVDPEILGAYLHLAGQEAGYNAGAAEGYADRLARARLAQASFSAQERLQAQNAQQQAQLQHLTAEEQMALERLRQAGTARFVPQGGY